VPVDDELAVAQVADEARNGKGRNGGRVLDEDPLSWREAAGEEVGEVVDLAEDLPWSEENERDGLWLAWGGGKRGDGDVGVAGNIRVR
jgi:hypothetical protein